MTDPQPRTIATPGHLLRAARRRYGWSVEDIAEELNLLPHVVEGLENDDYSVVAGHTYAVGYIRNYARLVGVTIEEALSAHNELIAPRRSRPTPRTNAPSLLSAMPVPVSWVVSTLVALAVVVGIGVTYLNRAEQSGKIALTGSIATNDLSRESPSDAKQSGMAQTSEVGTMDNQLATDISQSGATLSGAVEGGAGAGSDSTLDGLGVDGLVIDADLPAFDPGTRLYAVADDNRVKVLGTRELELYFLGASWIEVRDRDAKQLIGRRVESDVLVRLVGDPPFSIFIGTATSVRLRYRSQYLRPEPKEGRQFVRLMVGGSQS
jgi:cytoskeleton protein RodZ